MAISIVVEDGTGVANANSYVSIADARTYALNRGIVLSSVDDDVAAQLINATDYLENQSYKNDKVSETQSLSFPRQSSLSCDCTSWGIVTLPPTPTTPTIPSKLIAAQCQLVIEQFNGFPLQPSFTAQDYVVREQVSVLATEYSDPRLVGLSPKFNAVNALLKDLLAVGSGSFSCVRG